jgi:predicted RNA-binding Zn-ribbon protein involved in translation (DUF1610 family)
MEGFLCIAMFLFGILIVVLPKMFGEQDKPREPRSVGKCPACGSTKTMDVVEESRASDGAPGAYGARLGLSASGRGRFRCRKCGHAWIHGYSA